MTTSVVSSSMKEAQRRSSPSRKRRRRQDQQQYQQNNHTVINMNANGERLREWPMERMKTILAAVLLFASSLSTSFAVSFLNEVVPRDRPLPDVIFRLIPIQEWAWPISDILVVVMANICGWSMLLHKHRWILLRRIFLIASVLYFFRSLSMLVTWMPLSDSTMLNKCITPVWLRTASSKIQQHADSTNSAANTEGIAVHRQTNIVIPPWSLIGFRMWRYGISLGIVDLESDRVLCGDYIYSGHTLMYVLTTLTMRMYMPRTGFYGLLRFLFPMAAACGMFFVIISRLHYTIDVIIAYWMTTLTFWCYHLLIALPRASVNNEKQRSDSSETILMLPTVYQEGDRDDSEEETNGNWLNGTNRSLNFSLFGSRYILDYFERNVPAGVPLPRELHWPFTRPVWMCRFVNGLNEESMLSCDD